MYLLVAVHGPQETFLGLLVIFPHFEGGGRPAELVPGRVPVGAELQLEGRGLQVLLSQPAVHTQYSQQINSLKNQILNSLVPLLGTWFAF